MRKLFGVVLGLSLVVLGLSTPVSAGPFGCFRNCSYQYQSCGPWEACEAAFNACMCSCGDSSYC